MFHAPALASFDRINSWVSDIDKTARARDLVVVRERRRAERHPLRIRGTERGRRTNPCRHWAMYATALQRDFFEVIRAARATGIRHVIVVTGRRKQLAIEQRRRQHRAIRRAAMHEKADGALLSARVPTHIRSAILGTRREATKSDGQRARVSRKAISRDRRDSIIGGRAVKR